MLAMQTRDLTKRRLRRYDCYDPVCRMANQVLLDRMLCAIRTCRSLDAKPVPLPAGITLSATGVFSGGNILPENITDMDAFKKNVKLVFMSFGSRESSAPRGSGPLPSGPEGIKLAADALAKAGIKSVYYVSPDSAHDFTSWKRSLYFFSQRLFKD